MKVHRRVTSPWPLRRAAGGVALMAAATLWGSACNSDLDHPDLFLPPEPGGASPEEVIDLFQEAWRARDIDAYMRLLAEDFRFLVDPRTRRELGAASFDADWDSAAVARLFESPLVKNVAIELSWPGSPTPSGRPEAPGWVYVDVHDVFVDVDYKPEDREATTFRIEDQRQRFHFRQGIAPGDTLPESPTSERWFLVEWQDFGPEGLRSGSGPVPAIEWSTWSSVKVLGNGLP